MTSHYPTTSELAAFRRSIACPMPVYGARVWDDDMDHPDGEYADGRSGTVSPSRATFQHEKRDGIGFRSSDLTAFGHGWNVAARREAAAMRSRAYARLHCVVCGEAASTARDGLTIRDPWQHRWGPTSHDFAV